MKHKQRASLCWCGKAKPLRSAYENMQSGQPFDALDAELRDLRAQARLACAKFNQHPSKGNMRHITRLFRHLGSAVLEAGFQCDYGVHIEVGQNFYANFHCVLLDAAPIIMGDDVLLGPAVHIYTVKHPKDAALRRQGICTAEAVHIGHRVWIGGGAKIFPGVHIGDEAIIGANAVVRHDVAAGAMQF